MLERVIEKLLFASRWLLAPLYLGLAFILLLVVIKAAQHIGEMTTHILIMTESDLVLGLLSLIEMTLSASLIIIVIFSGYENFVSRIDPSAHLEWPEWMAHIDFAGLKLKLMASIVAISAVQLLRVFMDIKEISDRELMWSAGLHIIFVLSTIAFAFTERLSASSSHHQGE